MKIYEIAMVLSFVMLIALSNMSFASPTNASCVNPNTITSFNVVGVEWGYPSQQNSGLNQSRGVSSISVGPGQEDVPLTLTVDNNNNCELVDVQAKMPLVSYFTTQNSSSSYAIDNIQSVQPYSFFNVVYYLNIANNTSVGPNGGIYEKLNLYWNYTNSNEGYEYSTQFLVPLKGSTQLYFNESQHLTAGRINNVKLKVSNDGSGYAYAIKPSVESTTYVNQVGPVNKINVLTPNSTSYISVPIYVSPAAASTTAPVTFDVSYVNAYGYNETIPVTFGMYVVSPENNVSIGLSSNSITVGLLQNDTLGIANNDMANVTNATLTLTATPPLTLIGSSGYYQLGSIAAGKAKGIPVSLYITSSTNVATLTAQLNYVLDGIPYSITRPLSLLSPGYVNITNTGTTQLPASAIPGSIVSLTGTLLNTGSIPASAVTLITHSANGISILGENSTFLGTVDAYAPTAFTVSLSLSKTLKPGIYNIPVTIEYINNLNQKRSENITLPVNVSSSGAASSASGYNGAYNSSAIYKYRRSFDNILLYIVVIVIIVAAISAFVLKSRGKKLGKNKTK